MSFVWRLLIVSSAHNQFPSDFALVLSVLMVVLRRKRLALF